MQLAKNTILGVGVTNAKKKDVLEYVLSSLGQKGEKYAIATPNPEILVYANKHLQFKAILNQARIGLCDGVGLFEAGKFLGKPFEERIAGVDLMENLCQKVAESNQDSAKKPVSIGFLGGRKDVAERTADRLVKKYPGLHVVYVAEEWGQEGFARASERFTQMNKQINTDQWKSRPEADQPLAEASNPRESIDILFVAYGFPKQEEWIEGHLPEIPATVAMGVGGAFDYISGNVSRAPVWVRTIGLEWFYRLIRQPWRVKRQFALVEFVFLILKERIANARG